ncbi:dihydrolipoyl dehydrogenase [Conchiformibius steedae DSM 2580]|uniref:Dihydrolipoyl dehydrogenase n=2 Tax=Conchiformibius steedae TaxID=153493 RepID=A0A3P2A0E3_9NEIS|nr:dihydrolipoyl dehydrogenase [Conchiformibius steedae]QMT33630.1 dihydrolipoyl dehydrogenase [Conchiformibius steedae]RRD88872.1 dihydrolipoyl dehydrogenase [Conchiformibius steedae]URD68287.1 dihydrolipoyl dehydrogenase [Conchiformibius steedae DSM 2580]
MSQFDVAVIGAGPGGYVAAIRAAQLGLRTVCIDAGTNKAGDAPALGGTCLNVGCIPSKALLQSSEHVHTILHDFAEHGISLSEVRFDAEKMIERKDAIVTKLTGGIKYLFQKNKVESIFGRASFAGKHGDNWQLLIDNGKGEHRSIEATHVIVATGSVPRPLPLTEIDNINVLDNEGALNLTRVPGKLGVIGSGVIGLEMGSVWKRVGADVTILEAAPTFLAAADQQIAKEAFKYFTKEQGLNIELGVKIAAVNKGANSVSVQYEHNGESKTVVFDKLIVAIGRIPNTQGLNPEAVGLAVDERGFITVDDECRTNLPNVWAIGDVVRGPMLAHKASDEGVAVAERIVGQKPHLDFNCIPWVIYTDPEIAWAGKTEEQLKAEGIAYKKGTSGFGANGRALGLGKAKGTVKVLTCAETDRVLGVHMIGPMVSELVAEAVMALEFKASGEDIARIVHAHPTLSEVLHEAALAADKRALHG